MAALEAYTLSQLLADVGSVFTAMIGYVQNICEAITSSPLLLVGFAIPIAFAIVSFVRRLFYVG